MSMWSVLYSRPNPSPMALTTAGQHPISPAARVGPIGKADRGVGPRDRDHALVDLEVAGAGLQGLRGKLLELVAEILGRPLHTDSTRRDRRQAAGAEPGLDLIGVALVDM